MRHHVLPTLAVLAVTATSALVGPTLSATGQPAAGAPTTQPDQPNIVVILTDDQTRIDLEWMPQTRALIADAGVTFTDAIAPNPLCGPSRASLLTGQDSHNTGVHGNDSEQTLVDHTRLLPSWLHAAGYQTGFTGKYLNRYHASDAGEPGWDSFSAVTNGAHYFDYTMSNNGDPVHYTDVHVDDTVTDGTTALIDRFSGDDPFFVVASYSAPHGVCLPHQPCDDAPVPAARHADLYPDVVAPQLSKPSFNERDMSDKPPRIRRLPRADRADVQHDFTERIRALASVDEGVASTVAKLEATGELDDTLIVFTSDNGFQLGEHRHTGKVYAYEESLGVPLLMRGPGVPVGEVRDRTVTIPDLAPTLAAAAGAKPTLRVDGRDLGPYLRTGRVRPFTAIVESGLARNDWTYRGVRTDRYTLVRWRNGTPELYDRQQDPFQLRNVAGSRRYAAVEGVLERRLDRLSTCRGTAACSRVFHGLPDPG